MDRRLARSFALATLLAALGPAGDARAAGDTPQQIAEDHLRAGLKLYEQASYEAARLEFLQAQAVFPRPSLLRNLALCELKTNRPVEAIQHLRAYLADASTTGDKRENAKKNLAEALAKTGHVAIHAEDGVTVSVDGQPQQGTAPFKEPLAMLPGRHVLEARLGERTVTRDVEATAGTVIDVTLRFDERAAGSPAARAPEASLSSRTSDVSGPPRELEPSFWTTRRTLGVVAGGVAVVAAGVGGAFLLGREGHVSDGKDALADDARPCAQPSDPACAKYEAARDGIETSELGAAISIGAFVALGVTAAVLILWPDPKREAHARVLPVGRDLSVLGTF